MNIMKIVSLKVLELKNDFISFYKLWKFSVIKMDNKKFNSCMIEYVKICKEFD